MSEGGDSSDSRESSRTYLYNLRRSAQKPGRLCLALLTAGLLAGCTTFSVLQTDESPDERTIKTSIKATAWFSSAQSLTRLKALQTDKTQSFGTEAIGQHGSTNLVEALRVLDSILGKIRP